MVVIYSEYLEPLTRAFTWLKATGYVIHLQLTETWQREFQILENCSHPAMAMSAGAGYILSGVKIAYGNRSNERIPLDVKRKWNDHPS